MNYNPEKHHRQSVRLKGYDYSQSGAYFVTICTWKRECLFGEIADGEIMLNDAGYMIQKSWNKTKEHFSHADSDEFIVMPNHVHGIILLNNVGAQFIAPTSIDKPIPQCAATNHYRNKGAINHAPTIGKIVRAFKARCTYTINVSHNTLRQPLWQRNFYEHIIRNEDQLNRIREYIVNNPARWAEDKDNPANLDRRQ